MYGWGDGYAGGAWNGGGNWNAGAAGAQWHAGGNYGGGWNDGGWNQGAAGGNGKGAGSSKGGGGRGGDRGGGGGGGGGKGNRGGKGGGGAGGGSSGGGGSAQPPPSKAGVPLAEGEAMALNPLDKEAGVALLGVVSGTRERAKRNSGAQWAGVRADCGVVNSGRWAFCVWNESGGNLRIGWSTGTATLALGTDSWSFGYGGTATKSHAGNFEKFGQSYGKDDAITCCIDLDRRAILYCKNGREIPGDAFQLGKEFVGVPMFPHVYTKEATFSICFDGSGGAPPLQGGYQWISTAGANLVPSPKRNPSAAGAVKTKAAEVDSGSGPQFVMTSYGWRTVEQAGGQRQVWREALDAYVRHFTSSLEKEYAAEREAVNERVQRRSAAQLQNEGVGVAGLMAEFDQAAGRITLWADGWKLPYLAEISRGRAVLVSTVRGGMDIDDAKKTISAEVESIRNNSMILSTQYNDLPGGGASGEQYRVDLGPNIVANKRIDRFMDELQRCLGTSQAKKPMDAIQALNANMNLTGLLLPGAPLADALYADIQESSASASKWDPLQRPKPNPQADISRHSRERDIGAAPYQAKSTVHSSKQLNESQANASKAVLEERRRFSLIQGPPGTGKTTTASAIVCGWLRQGKGPILATAFSNRGCDNIAQQLHSLGVRVLRMGLCEAEAPYSLDTRLQEIGQRRGEKGLKAVLQTVDVVAATCIGCGMGPLDSLTFPYVVVDEAAQVIEPAVLLPLGKGAVQAVMVGDQCQLPATVLSQEAQKAGLDISLFDRLLSMGMEYQLLVEQYRMHPTISAFPSWRFYRGELKNAVAESDRQLPEGHGLPFRTPLVFLHVDANEASGGASKKNPGEAACVAWLVNKVTQAGFYPEDIGIISPYAAQVAEIRRNLPESMKWTVQVSSVDAFQGSEREVMLVSLTRANKRGDVGFVSDWRRLNVGLTRAKRLCVVISNIPTWIASESALFRDWLGYHRVGKADVKAFYRGSLEPLPEDIAAKVSELREQFTKENPQPKKLPRVTVAARSVNAASKRTREMEQLLVDALNGDDETVLKTTIAQAKEAGVEKSTIDEGERALDRMVAQRKLAAAVQGKDPAVLCDALQAAQQAGVDSSFIEEANAVMGNLVGKVAPPPNLEPPAHLVEDYYKPAVTQAAEPVSAVSDTPAGAEKKKAPKKGGGWASLVNTGPKYAGRYREDAEPEPEASAAGGDDWGAPAADAGDWGAPVANADVPDWTVPSDAAAQQRAAQQAAQQAAAQQAALRQQQEEQAARERAAEVARRKQQEEQAARERAAKEAAALKRQQEEKAAQERAAQQAMAERAAAAQQAAQQQMLQMQQQQAAQMYGYGMQPYQYNQMAAAQAQMAQNHMMMQGWGAAAQMGAMGMMQMGAASGMPAQSMYGGVPAVAQQNKVPRLRVHPEHGAGLECSPTRWGMHVDAVEAKPGQPDVQAGTTITSINGVSLAGLADQDAVEAAFGSGFADGAVIVLDPDVTELVPLPSEASRWPPQWRSDVGMLSEKYAVTAEPVGRSIQLRGPSQAMPEAKAELSQLLGFYAAGGN